MKLEKPSWPTSNIALVAALHSLGFSFVNPGEPCSNTYGKDEDVPLDRNGVPLRPGNVVFKLTRTSDEFPETRLQTVLDEWKKASDDENAADFLLDSLLEPSGLHAEAEALKKAVRAILPMVLMRCMKGALSNRKEAAGMWRKVPPQRFYQEDGFDVLIPLNASDDMKHQLGVSL